MSSSQWSGKLRHLLHLASRKLFGASSRHQRRSKTPENWDFFIRATLHGARDLRDVLNLSENDFRSASGFSHADARAWYLYGALDEIMRANVVLRQWAELLVADDEGEESKQGDPPYLRRVILETVLDEQDLRRRRLMELLVDLICFRETNEQDYYRHYLLLRFLRDHLTATLDFKDFYSLSSRRLRAQLEGPMRWASDLETTKIDPQRSWYRQDGVTLSESTPPAALFTSFRTRLKSALQTGTANEKLVLGTSYYGYSSASGGIHYYPDRRPNRYELLTQARQGIPMTGVLALNCLVACQKLMANVPEGVNRQLLQTLENSPEIRQIFEGQVSGRAKVGDFVLAYGQYLAEVERTKVSDFGYESYRLRFLEEHPPRGIECDWLPPQEVCRLSNLDRIAEDTRREMIESGAQEPVDKDEVRAAVRRAIAEVWQTGLRDVILKQSVEGNE